MTEQGQKRAGIGCGGMLLILLLVIGGIVAVYRVLTKEERARERAGNACFKRVNEKFGECLKKQGLTKDAGDEIFEKEEFADCLDEQIDGWAACGYERLARIRDVFRLTEPECRERALSREKKCIGGKVLAGDDAEEAKSSCGVEREAAYGRCADRKSRDRN